MSKETVKQEAMPLWLTRDTGAYVFWLAKPQRRRDGIWDYDRLYKKVCPQIFHRCFPKTWRLGIGGGPLECVLTVKA